MASSSAGAASFAEAVTLADAAVGFAAAPPPPPPPADPSDALTSLKAIEDSAKAVAEDAAKLVGTAHEALRAMTTNAGDYMEVYRSTAQHASEAVSVSVAQGRSFITRCEQLDAEMAKVDALAEQVRSVKDSLGALEASLNHNKRGAGAAAR